MSALKDLAVLALATRLLERVPPVPPVVPPTVPPSNDAAGAAALVPLVEQYLKALEDSSPAKAMPEALLEELATRLAGAEKNISQRNAD